MSLRFMLTPDSDQGYLLIWSEQSNAEAGGLRLSAEDAAALWWVLEVRRRLASECEPPGPPLPLPRGT